MNFNDFNGYGRTLCIEFKCQRCEKTEYRPVEVCSPNDFAPNDLTDFIPPRGWRNGGIYGYLLCPECAQKFDAFMKGEGMLK